MKTKILFTIGIALLLFSGCTESEPNKEELKTKRSFRYAEMYSVEYDSCEYIIYNRYNKGGITHKGNCKNCKTQNK